MKKLLLVAILMLALVFTVVACNNNEPAETTAGETTVGQVPGTAEPAPETEAPEVPTEAPEVTTAAPEVPTEPETTVEDAPVTSAPPVVTTEPVTEAPVDPAAPVLKVEPDALASAATGNTASGIAGAEVMTEGGRTFVRLTASNGDPFFVAVSNAGAMPDYVAISYRTNSATDGEFFVGSGAGATGQGDNFQFVWNEGDWNLAIINLAETGVTTITDGVIGYLRLDCFAGNSAAGDYFDVEYVAFFNTAEYAQAYNFEMHKAPMWDVDKSVVTHQSFDELDTYAGGNKVAGVFAPGASSGWDKIVTLPDFSVDTLRYWGWIGAKGELGQFGYQINGGSAIYDDAWTHATEQPVIDAAATTGADCASRMQIMISLAGLDGENTIRVLYKTADGIEVCLNEFTVILPEKPKDIKDTFEADVNANDVGTGLGASDLADYFTVELPLGSEGVVANGEGKMYSMTMISDMYADVNGKYFIQSNNLASGNGFMFVRGYKVVNSDEIIEKFDPAAGFYKINNYYEQDMAGQMGGAGIYARLEGGTLYIMVKYYNPDTATRVGNKIYSLAAEGTELTMADDGEVVSILVNGKTYATIALSGSTTYADINEVIPKNGFAASAVVTLADGKTETIENTLIAETCECQVGVVVRGGHFKFDALKVGAYSAIEVPEIETEQPRENIALNKPVSSDNIENEANIPSNATDGDEVTRFGALPTGEVKLVVDLEGVYALDDMKVLFENASCEYEIAVSVDGVNYTTIYTDANHGATTKNIKDLGGVNARYILFHRLPTAAEGHFWFSIYELYVYGEKVAEPEIPEDPSNEIKVSTTDTYTWIDVVEFTATATGNYTFTLPAGLGAWDVYACDNWAGDPYVDFYANETGAKFTVGLTEGATTTFYVGATTKADWTITWEYTEGEVEPEETEPSDLTTIEPVIGENTVTITDADMTEGAVMGTLTVDKAGQYSIVAADFMGIFFVDGMQQRGSAWLEPGTYEIALAIFAWAPGTYNYTLTVEYPPVPGEEDLPFEWDGDVTVEGAHDVWYTYTADQDGILVITYPEGNWISGIANKTDAAYSVAVSEGETVKFNIFGSNAGTYSIKMVKFIHANIDEFTVGGVAQPFDSDVLFVDKGTFDTILHRGWVAVLGETAQFCVEINGKVIFADEFNVETEAPVQDAAVSLGGTLGARYAIAISVDDLKLGGNLIKVGVAIDGQAIHYFWEYTVVMDMPEYYDNYNVPQDQWVISGHMPQIVGKEGHSHSGMVAAGGVNSGALLHQGSICLGEIDLSKYSKVIVYVGMDNSQVTINHHAANANNRLMLVSANMHMVNSPSEDTIIAATGYNPMGWAVVAYEIDLTGVDYNGPVYFTYDTLPGTFLLVGSVEFIGGVKPDEPEVTEPADPEVTEPEEPEVTDPEEPGVDEPVIDDTTYGKTTISLSVGGQGAPYSGTKTFGQRYNIGENVLRGIWVYAMATYDDGNVNTWSVKVWQWNGTYADTVAGTPLAVVTGSNHENCQPFSVDISAEYGITGDIYYEIEYLTGSKQFTGWTASGGAAEGVETYVAGELKDGTYIASLTVLDLSKPIDPNGPAHQIGATDIVSAAANGNMIGSAEKLTEGEVTFARLTAGGGDPWALIANGLGTMPNYMAVAYRTNCASDGQFFVGSGGGPTGAGDFFNVNWSEDESWHIAIIDLTTCGVTSISNGNINYLRFDFFVDNGAAGDYIDVEWIAFFDSVEKAETYFAKTH